MRVAMIDDVYFFFFKQKTAYEMRISDWSSDVCSSDLLTDQSRRAHSLADSKDHKGVDDLDRRIAQAQEKHNREASRAQGRAETQGWAVGIEFEIGRASCRERVCQYG